MGLRLCKHGFPRLEVLSLPLARPAQISTPPIRKSYGNSRLETNRLPRLTVLTSWEFGTGAGRLDLEPKAQGTYDF